ncbi:FecR family protein [Echinicola rosea]|uniref:Anti-sigma factor n=1 Tax=Echinicola rosea TaxID=1807691 RepID=A0ABQ1V737_9BACT|nr:FecR family protein [Echinicola rosea]GGF41002.1 anti-sigma factor [Echinicola rosea]
MDSSLLRKFFAGKCSPEEVHMILVWINSKTGKQQLEAELDDFEPKAGAKGMVDSKKLFEKIEEQISKEEQALRNIKIDRVSTVRRGEDKRIKRWYMAAAMIGMLAIVSFLILKQSSMKEETKTEVPVAMVTKTTEYGQKLKLTLADGSHVHLNAGSKLVFPKRFEGAMREVYLEGEAFFDVHRDEKKPFIVKTPHTLTKVLGTSFVVKELTNSDETKVGVLTGKVKVSAQNSGEELSYFLLPMEAVSYSSVDGSMKKRRVHYDDMFAWKDNVISFKRASFKEVVDVLTKWFGVEFEIRKGFTSKKDFTGKFEPQSLEQILDGLSFTFGFRFQIENNKVTIY